MRIKRVNKLRGLEFRGLVGAWPRRSLGWSHADTTSRWQSTGRMTSSCSTGVYKYACHWTCSNWATFRWNSTNFHNEDVNCVTKPCLVTAGSPQENRPSFPRETDPTWTTELTKLKINTTYHSLSVDLQHLIPLLNLAAHVGRRLQHNHQTHQQTNSNNEDCNTAIKPINKLTATMTARKKLQFLKIISNRTRCRALVLNQETSNQQHSTDVTC